MARAGNITLDILFQSRFRIFLLYVTGISAALTADTETFPQKPSVYCHSELRVVLKSPSKLISYEILKNMYP